MHLCRHIDSHALPEATQQQPSPPHHAVMEPNRLGEQIWKWRQQPSFVEVTKHTPASKCLALDIQPLLHLNGWLLSGAEWCPTFPQHYCQAILAMGQL